MSLLGGVYSPGASASELRSSVSRQLLAMRGDNPGLREFRYFGPTLGLGLLDAEVFENGSQPVTTADERYALFLDGEIFNYDELRRALPPHEASEDLSAPQICLRFILEHGEQALSRLNGQFLIVLYDRQEYRLRLVTDRFGFRPLFYAHDNARFCFASNLRGLRAADPNPTEVDELGTLELFCYGTCVFDRSWIKDYFRLPPSTVMTVDRQGIRKFKYWRYQFEESGRRLDQQTYVTVFAKLLDRAVERRMQGSRRIGIFLSGGYDSRAIAAAIRKHHRPIPAFTFGVPQSRDARFAAMLAERLGLEHYLLTSASPCLTKHCKAIIWRNEGLIPFVHNTSIVFHEHIKSKADLILTGFLGEYSGSHTWPRLLRTRSRHKAIPVIFDRMVGPRIADCTRIFDKKFFAPTFKELRSAFDRSFEGIENHNPLNMSDAWDYTYRHPWSYQAAAVDRPCLEVRAPHLDVDLVDFLLSIPWHARLEQRVYKKMIAYSYPEIRDVPCTNSSRPIDPRFLAEYLKMTGRYVARRLTEPIRTMVGAHKPLGRELSDLAEEVRAEPELWRDILEPMLENGIFEPSMFDLHEIRNLVAEHYDGRADHEMTIAQLISWGLAKSFLLCGRADASSPVNKSTGSD